MSAFPRKPNDVNEESCDWRFSQHSQKDNQQSFAGGAPTGHFSDLNERSFRPILARLAR